MGDKGRIDGATDGLFTGAYDPIVGDRVGLLGGNTDGPTEGLCGELTSTTTG